jgi:hypothetical protein
MWLTGRLKPDFKTIANFRKDNKSAIEKAFYRFGYICGELGMIGKERIAVDGSKFNANNSRNKWYNKNRLEKQLEYYRKSASKYLELLDSGDNEEESDTAAKLNAAELREKLFKANLKIKELEALGQTVKETGEVSLTDKDSKIMKMNNGGCGICHNVQIAVDAKAHFVVAVDVTSQSGDKEQLHNISLLAKTAVSVDTITVLADKVLYGKRI